MEVIRFKQHQYITTRNGHTTEKYEEYELVVKPVAQIEPVMEELQAFINTKDSDAYFDWNHETKHQEGTLPLDYECWCEVIGDFLVSSGFEYSGSDNWDRAEIWVRNK